ncbi:MAG: hypothetical protein ACYS22_19655, partial [Planctomycetota bacterium]
GNHAAQHFDIVADWNPPQITAEAKVTVRVTGRVDDPKATVTVDGQPATVNRDGSFFADVAPPASGFVTVVATDAYGNSSEAQVTVPRRRGRGNRGGGF